VGYTASFSLHARLTNQPKNQPTNQLTNKLNNKVTNSVEQCSSERKISSAIKEKPRTVRNLTVQYHGHRSSLTVPILSQVNLGPAVPRHPISLHMSLKKHTEASNVHNVTLLVWETLKLMQSSVEQKIVSGFHVHPISKNGLLCLIQGRVGKTIFTFESHTHNYLV
jgi:hypothetical protein